MLMRNYCVGYRLVGLLAVLVIGLSPGLARAGLVEITFQAQIVEINDDEEDISQANVGDILLGRIVYESTAAEDFFVGNYLNAVSEFSISILQEDNGSFFETPLLSDTTADIFVGTDQFSVFYFVDIFTGNMEFSLLKGPPFNFSLTDATDLLIAEGINALDLFSNEPVPDPSDNSHFDIQTDFTFGSATAVFDFVQVRAVPEPSTFVLCALGLPGLGFAAWRKNYRRA